jgi:hypothetical protein
MRTASAFSRVVRHFARYFAEVQERWHISSARDVEVVEGGVVIYIGDAELPVCRYQAPSQCLPEILERVLWRMQTKMMQGRSCNFVAVGEEDLHTMLLAHLSFRAMLLEIQRRVNFSIDRHE